MDFVTTPSARANEAFRCHLRDIVRAVGAGAQVELHRPEGGGHIVYEVVADAEGELHLRLVAGNGADTVWL